MEKISNKQMKELMLKHLNKDYSLLEDDFFTIDLKEISELNTRNKNLEMEILFNISSCEDCTFYISCFLGFNLKDQNKTFFELDDIFENFGFCEFENDVDNFCEKLENFDKFKLNTLEIENLKKYNWEYFSVADFPSVFCKEYLEEMLDKDDYKKIISSLYNIF